MKPDKVSALVKKAALTYKKLSNPVLREHHLTDPQYAILQYLYAMPRDTVRQVDLGDFCSISHQTAMGILNALEAKGLITRKLNPEDSRSRIVSLTVMAYTRQPELMSLDDRLEDSFTQKLTREERQQLVTLLQKLLETEAETTMLKGERRSEYGY